ncbi:MAG: J domain-containing protein, partial [Candidatus Aminicenantes bacterium]|nr:J domain-containing protein [Candidatus Aminicenantes bacterium]
MEHIGFYLKEIFFHSKRGQLLFRHDAVQKYLFFHNGNLVSAKTNQPQELLGEVLYKLGKIKDDVYSKIDQYIEPKKKLGEVLVKNSLISENELREGLSYQMREILLNTFSDFEGEFKFQKRDDFSDQEFDIKINIPLLIEDGVRRMKYDPAIKAFFESKRPFPKSKSFFYRLTEEEKEILEAIRGDVSAALVFQKSRFHPEVFWKSLFLFFCLDLIDFPEDEKKIDSSRSKKGTSIGDMEKNIADALALSENLSKQDHYQLLNVETSADQAEIKRNYFRLARKFHPDLYGRDLPYEIKGVIEAVFDQVSKAYQTLSNEKKRKIYDTRKEKAPLEDKRNWAKVAEVKFRQGKTLFDKEQYQEAIALLEEAVKLQGDKGRYFLLLALAQSKIPSLHRKSEGNFILSIRHEPWNAEGYVGLGMLYKREGLFIKAKNKFEKALRIDPDHRVAQR